MEALFQVLGPVQVLIAGRRVEERAAKPRIVLATLLLHANDFVPVAYLNAALWGQDDPARGRSTLPTYVMRLRRLLDSLGLLCCPIETLSGGYTMHLPPEMLDLSHFKRLIARSREAAAQGDLAGEAVWLGEALDLWHGLPLSNVDSEVLHRDEVPRLIELGIQARERKFDLELELGRCAEVVPDLRRLTALYPRRERLWAQLMKALYRAGRQAEALDTYLTVRRSLAEDLGIDPGPELQGLHLAMLNGGYRSGAPTAAPHLKPVPGSGPAAVQPAVPVVVEPSPVRTAPADVRAPAWATECQLPPDISQFVGRELLVERVAQELIHDERPGVPSGAAICGRAGVGKTALAVRVGYLVRGHFPDGQLFVNLHDPDGGRRSPWEVLGELLENLGMEPAAIPAGTGARLASFRARLTGKRLLLVLDDAADVTQVQPLLPAAAGCAALVTSRSSMLGLTALYGSQSFLLPPLGPDESVDLLSRIVGRQRVVAEPRAAADLIALCGQLPLALRIAAAQLAGLPGRTLADYVSEVRCDPVARLSMGTASAVSVAASLDRSYQRLAEEPRRLLPLLGLLCGGAATAETAAALSQRSPAQSRRLLEDLVGVSLLEPVDQDRYRLPELVGRYAWDKAHEELSAEQRTAAVRGLLDFYLACLANAARLAPEAVPRGGPAVDEPATGLAFRGPEAAVDWFAAERDTVLTVARYAACQSGDTRAAALVAMLLPAQAA